MNRRTLMPLMVPMSAVAMLFAGAVGCPAALGDDARGGGSGWAVTVVAKRGWPAEPAGHRVGTTSRTYASGAGATPMEWPATRRTPAI